MEIEFTLDGKAVRCPDGLTVAGALFHLGVPEMRSTPRLGWARSVFCGMGVCFDCAMEIDGRPSVRACTTLVRPGMRVVRHWGAPKVVS
jgi:predicted molibdopterin-dependent oxidoreductase YjgC